MNDHAELIDKFIASFESVAVNLDFFEALDTVAAKLAVGPTDDYGQRHWRPAKVRTDSRALQPLYEELALSYR